MTSIFSGLIKILKNKKLVCPEGDLKSEFINLFVRVEKKLSKAHTIRKLIHFQKN